jgi:hypothetical protein
MQGRVHAGDATHHRLDVTFGTSRRGRQAASVWWLLVLLVAGVE